MYVCKYIKSKINGYGEIYYYCPYKDEYDKYLKRIEIDKINKSFYMPLMCPSDIKKDELGNIICYIIEGV